MGGRGSSSGISDKGKKYGTEYRTVYQSGNIKFIKINKGAATAPMETMTKGRVYVTLDNKDNLNLFLIMINLTSVQNKLILTDHIKV